MKTIDQLRNQKIPSNVFNEIKEKSIKIWETYDNEFGYVDSKVNRIKSIENIKDNAGSIISMFDLPNQISLYNSLSSETREYFIENLHHWFEPGLMHLFKD